MEYTLEDAYETLKDAKGEREREIEELADEISNNEVDTLNQSTTVEKVKTKFGKHCTSLLKYIEREEPRDYPIPRTSDLRAEALAATEQEIADMQNLFAEMKARLAEIEADVAYLQNKKDGLEKMKEAYLNSVELVSNKTYENELGITKKIFKDVKNDLYNVVDTIFPDNDSFKELLAALSAAYTKGGDDIYVDITPDVIDCVIFMAEADLITYHRNDKNKIRLIDLL